jgi:MFS family permease
VIGVLLGGVLTQALGWESVFFVNVLLAGLALLMAFQLIARDGERNRLRKFDCRARSALRLASPCSCRPGPGADARLERAEHHGQRTFEPAVRRGFRHHRTRSVPIFDRGADVDFRDVSVSVHGGDAVRLAAA